MSNKQLKLMRELAKELKSKQKTQAEIFDTLVAAGIVTKSGNYTKNYAPLQKIENASAKG